MPNGSGCTTSAVSDHAGSLNNIVKHSGAAHARIELWGEAAQLVLHITDDGCGFEQAVIPANHFGLGIMRERAEAIGASFQLQSTPGCGSHLTITLPLTPTLAVKKAM